MDFDHLGSSNYSRMRFLWISFLLFGTIVAIPQDSEVPYMRFPPSFLGPPVSQYAKPSDQVNFEQISGYQGSSSPNMAAGPSRTVSSQSGYTASSGQQQAQPSYQSGPYYYGTSSGGAGSTSGAGSRQSGSAGGQYQVQQQSWSSSSDGDSDQEPDFTPVSEEDQVYAFKSRSRYNQKRLQFSQFRYTPTEPLELETPEIPYHGKGSDSKGPVKGKY